MELGNRTPLSKTGKSLKQTGRCRIGHQKIKETRCKRGPSHCGRETSNEPRAHRDASSIVKLLQPFRFKASHVDVGRALGLATFAGETEIHDWGYLIAVKRIGFRRAS